MKIKVTDSTNLYPQAPPVAVSTVFAPVARFLDYLLRVHPSVTDIQLRRQSRLLVGMTFAILMISLMTIPFLIAKGSSGNLVPLIPGQLLMLVVFVVNRSGRVYAAALLFVAVNFALMHLAAALTHDTAWLLFACITIILGAIFLSLRAAILMYLASLAFQIGLSIVSPTSAFMSSGGAFFIFLMTSSLVLVFMNHREGLERERQEELRAANKLLRESEIVLERRVAERTAELEIARQEAEQARDHAIQSDQIKSQFLASMSHELRTPMNSILTFTELIAMGTFGDVNEEQKDYLLKSLQSGRHLLSLINDVLDITKIQSGMMKLFIESDLNIAKEIETVAASTEKLLGDKPVEVVLDIDPGLPTLTCDKRRVRQVLLNLASNAVKFTDAGSITLSVKRQPEVVLFAVIDTGPGIAPDQQEIIFEPFVQTETGIRHIGGTGLGLPISRSLVAAHGGRLWVESEPGHGAAFYFTLPLQPAVLPAAGTL